jgi:PAS domain S-box-containing protein
MRLQTVEREVQTRDGRWFLMRILPYRTPDDRIDGVVLTFVEITERRRVEMRLREGEERLRLLIDSVVDYAIFTITEDGRIATWNPGAQRVFGFSADEIVGREAAILFTPEDRAVDVPARELSTAREHGRASDEREHVRKDGSRFYCSGVTTRIAAGGFVKIARDLTERRQSEIAVEEARQSLEGRVQQRTRQLQEEVERGAAARAHVTTLLHRLVSAQEDERTRIARDLHDLLGQQLTALRLALERQREGAPAERLPDLDAALELAHTIDREVDFLAWELRPAALDDLGLTAALPRYVHEWSTHYRIPAEFHAAPSLDGQLSPTAEIAFYRIAQEALNNVVKHAHASRVDVLLEHRDGAMVLVVEDDGVGFEPASQDTAERGLGLAGMRERAALAGATLEIESAPGNGTAVYLRCPLGGGGGKPA